jgi:3-isopropylmalate/(R)-2-methylmalate dehydratase large subunit
MSRPRTLYDKLWYSHLVADYGDETGLLYIDRQLIHEVSSPQSFSGLRRRAVPVRRAQAHLAVADHAVPTRDQGSAIADPLARAQVELLAANARDFGIRYIPLGSLQHGIVHVIGPELGFTQPGMSLVCGDSHTSTHGAFGALAMGIGASQSECVLATQVIKQRRMRNLQVAANGVLPAGVGAKDLALCVVGLLGAQGASGYAVEYTGETVRSLSMEGRMTLCNMTIEAGARIGLVAPDETTYAYLAGRPMAPRGDTWTAARAYWETLPSDPDAAFDRVIHIDAAALEPQVTWGTSPDQVVPVSGNVPRPVDARDTAAFQKAVHAIAYMDLNPGEPVAGIAIDHAFIGSCTNSRIEDLRAAAAIVSGHRCAPGVQAIVVPGSGQVKAQAEREGLDAVFRAAGFQWRNPGCSLCVAMNDDRLAPGARCASTSNRNFEGRQGVGSRTHLMSPIMAAAAALAGCIVDVRQWLPAA